MVIRLLRRQEVLPRVTVPPDLMVLPQVDQGLSAQKTV